MVTAFLYGYLDKEIYIIQSIPIRSSRGGAEGLVAKGSICVKVMSSCLISKSIEFSSENKV